VTLTASAMAEVLVMRLAASTIAIRIT